MTNREIILEQITKAVDNSFDNDLETFVLFIAGTPEDQGEPKIDENHLMTVIGLRDFDVAQVVAGFIQSLHDGDPDVHFNRNVRV